ncbi:DUF4760 domain-containing protein [Hellea sp.]|nr:DUF4760 domain-containing protein [Hellea sp.]
MNPELIEIITLIILTIALVITAFQLNLLRQNRIEQHDWNRRIAAQKALYEYKAKGAWKHLDAVFDYHDDTNPIQAKEIKEAFLKEDNLKSELFDLLNFYESLARGINYGIYDESVIKAARKNAMIKVTHFFKAYIRHYRQEKNPHAWIQFTDTVERWKNEDRLPLEGKRQIARKP